MSGRWAASVAMLLLGGCGTFQLGIVQPQAGLTREQQQSDVLYCKDQALMQVSSSDHQVADFLLGFTIIGAPVAYEADKNTQRQAFTACMQARGYKVTPAP